MAVWLIVIERVCNNTDYIAIQK
uniref:Uncharacterized protein n=1 Tax=Anguilla anguilla TaxID=7936 RepID=A0A0E9UYB1_ANGAN